jgi:hypothetical protein
MIHWNSQVNLSLSSEFDTKASTFLVFFASMMICENLVKACSKGFCKILSVFFNTISHLTVYSQKLSGIFKTSTKTEKETNCSMSWNNS